jgi:nephrocystin-3
MYAERDYLLRYVFPRVREELLKRRLYFIDVDLRWGLNGGR